MNTHILSWILEAYLLVFAAGVVGIAIWLKKRRKDRPPVEFKLLRGPGESLRRRMAKFDENSWEFFLLHAGIPILASGIILQVIVWLKPQTMAQLWCGIGAAAVVFLALVLFSGCRAIKQLQRYSNDRLGYLGEREVAEYLQPVYAKGCRVFHDVPAEGAHKDFNLDHVVVGPSGVAMIEVKTPRKGRARPGFKDHVVIYDGSQLIWPWGECRTSLDQAIAEADWLQKWIKQRTGIDTPVKPILALPGWWVEARGRGDVAVVNSKTVAKAIEGKGNVALSEEQIDLIARQLDLVCRDVED